MGRSLHSRLNSADLPIHQVVTPRDRWTGSLRLLPDWTSIHSQTRPSSPSPKRPRRRITNLNRSDTLTSHAGLDSPGQNEGGLRARSSKDLRSLIGRSRHKNYDPDDEFQLELIRQAGNGVRVWYESYSTIDWLHESIKESIRKKNLARIPGISGIIARLWDRSQAWVLVTILGICTALMAGLIASMEMYFFDLKDGYCRTAWLTPKRFCCRPDLNSTAMSATALGVAGAMNAGLSSMMSLFDTSDALPWLDSATQPNQTSALIRSVPFTSRSFISHWIPAHRMIFSPSNDNLSIQGEVNCPDWQPWTDPWFTSPDQSSNLTYVLLALTLAGLSSTLTVYLSSYTQVLSQRHLNSQAFSSESYPPDSYFPQMPPAGAPQPVAPTKVTYFASGSGIPEIKSILSGFVIRGYLGARTLISKSIGLALSVGSGLSLGKEGPLVHISCCIGNLLTRLFPKFQRNEGKRREILSAACAAGVAAAFGAPIGGVLFSLEEVSYYFPARVMWRSCWCAMVTAATLRALDPFRTGKTILFEVTYDRPWHFFEFYGFILLGILTGILGALFAKFNSWWSRHFRKMRWVARHPILEVLAVALVTALIGLPNRFMRIGGTELVYEMLEECDLSDVRQRFPAGPCIRDPKDTGNVLVHLGITVLLKFFITVVTFGIKCPAGIFIPSLSMGALLGRMLGLAFEYIHFVFPNSLHAASCDPHGTFGQACIIPGVWAIVGAAAMLAGVTRTTVSLVVIVAELTGRLNYILPIAISVLVAKTTADVIERRSVYDLVIEASELPYLDGKVDYLHYARPVDIMDARAAVIELKEDLKISDLRELVDSLLTGSQRGGSGFPILEGHEREKRVVGYVGLAELEQGLSAIEAEKGASHILCTFSGLDPDSGPVGSSCRIDLGHLVDHAPVTVSVQSPMELLHEMFVRLGVRYIIIQDQYGSYMGIIEKSRWLRYLSWIEGEGYQAKNQRIMI